MNRNVLRINELSLDEQQMIGEYISKLFQIGICYMTKKESEI